MGDLLQVLRPACRERDALVQPAAEQRQGLCRLRPQGTKDVHHAGRTSPFTTTAPADKSRTSRPTCSAPASPRPRRRATAQAPTACARTHPPCVHRPPARPVRPSPIHARRRGAARRRRRRSSRAGSRRATWTTTRRRIWRWSPTSTPLMCPTLWCAGVQGAVQVLGPWSGQSGQVPIHPRHSVLEMPLAAVR